MKCEICKTKKDVRIYRRYRDETPCEIKDDGSQLAKAILRIVFGIYNGVTIEDKMLCEKCFLNLHMK